VGKRDAKMVPKRVPKRWTLIMTFRLRVRKTLMLRMRKRLKMQPPQLLPRKQPKPPKRRKKIWRKLQLKKLRQIFDAQTRAKKTSAHLVCASKKGANRNTKIELPLNFLPDHIRRSTLLNLVFEITE